MTTERQTIISGARSDMQILGVQSSNATQIILGNRSSGSTVIDNIAAVGGLLQSSDTLELIDRYTAMAAENFRWGHEAFTIIHDTNIALRNGGLPELSENEAEALTLHSREAFVVHTNQTYTDNDFFYESVPFEVSTDGGRSYDFTVNSPETYNEALSALFDPRSGGNATLRYDAGDGYFLVHRYQRVDNGDGVRINVFESVVASDGSPVPEDVADSIIGSNRVWQFEMDGDQVRALSAHDSCFGAEVPIDMWPLDHEFAPDPNNPYMKYCQEAARAKIWKKPIELIRVGDIVASFDGHGNLVPGRVTRTFKNDAKILLNFFGTRVTPGHVYLRPDSKKSHKFETLIDILRDDGVIKQQDGTLIRAAINVPVGDARDGFVQVITGARSADGRIIPSEKGRVRLGTRFIVDGSRSYAIADLIEAGGGTVGEDELIRVGDGPPMPFHWEFGDALPKPEDFVLECSGTTLEDIYRAGEWEGEAPHMPVPLVLDRGPIQPLTSMERDRMPRNEPLSLDPDTEVRSTASGSMYKTDPKLQ